MALLNQEERQRIEAKIRDVEARTAGEVVVASVARAADYNGLRTAHAAFFALVTAVLLHPLLPALGASWLLLLQLPLSGAYYLLFGVPGVLRRLVPRADRLEAVQERAARMFTERGVFDTREHSGVLIMLSELERRVVILGDRGVNARVRTDGWERHVSHIVRAIHAGRAGHGVCEVLDELGAVLAEAFPRRDDDRNELPDAVIQEKG